MIEVFDHNPRCFCSERFPVVANMQLVKGEIFPDNYLINAIVDWGQAIQDRRQFSQ